MSQEKCTCGREYIPQKPHCPGCGRSACYAKPSRAFVVETTRGPARIMVFACRGCGIEFNDLDRARCEAPSLSMSMKTRRGVDKAIAEVADMPMEERKKLAFEMLAKYGQSASSAMPHAVKAPSKPFEIGDDRNMINEAIRDSGATIEEVKSEEEKTK